ncbi:MAG: hypothetical protein FWC19_05710 [Treponema sp.]|nr:hypothetical protein [Treponema sp.]MCL2272284.1 hypothetical protein [Treponema sp.]
MKMFKHASVKCRFLTILLLACVTITGFTQVDRDELDNLPPVVFINYEGPHARIDTREQIRQIGVVLGQQIVEREGGLAPTLEAMSVEQRRQYSYIFEIGGVSRYFVIHSVSAPDGNKLDADVFGLGVDAGVDHIRNLRTIVQGYLQQAYQYSAADAALLAEYITIYNAVYRGNWDYFTSRYKTPVISHLTRDRAGLSIRYDEWPGRTLMLIPLGHGGLSAIDTSAITDSRVIEEMRKEEDMGIPQRQDMVDLMERQAEEARQQAQLERERAAQEERRIAEERQRLEQERQTTQQQQETGAITQQEAERREQEIQQREEELEAIEEETAQRLEEADRLDEIAEQRIDDAQREREEIASDQQSIIVRDTPAGILGISIEKTEPVATGRLIRFDTATGNQIRRSPLDSVHVRTVTFIGGKILAIAGENVNQGAIRLIEVTQDSLTMAKQGDDDIKAGSLLWVNGSDLYAITSDSIISTDSEGTAVTETNYYLGRFDTNLILQAKSIVKVHPDAAVTIQQGNLLTQDEYGVPIILNPLDLAMLFRGN